MERLAYLLKQRLPALFRWVEAVARVVTRLRFGRRIAKAEGQSRINGSVNGKQACIRALDVTDVDALQAFVTSLPEE